ncbi:ABC transporter [Afifella sp. IM 167]|nr:ABC transporter ATP-binding protein [Afifella sp. IM 167]MBZ8134322.1 ABC transporter [Afifella sp. IM 167]
MPVVACRGVEKSFRSQRVLDALDLDIWRQDRVALVGSNGAGKTTLIRCILGEYRHGGTVRLEGADPRRDRVDVLRRVGFVPQLPPPLKMPVAELLRYAANLVGVKVERMTSVAADMGLSLDEALKKPFNKLSGGQKQKLLIGIALGRECDLLILDEPTANLDPPARQTLFRLLAERPRTAMLISSHRLEEVASLVNRVIEMDRGKVVLDDTVSEMMEGAPLQACRILVSRPQEAFRAAIAEWGFESRDGLEWRGRVAGQDRLRFLGMLSRYAGLLAAVHIEDERILEEEPA